MNSEELDPDAVSHSPDVKDAIMVSKGSFSWDKFMKPTLSDIDLTVSQGALVAVVGPVGSGMTSAESREKKHDGGRLVPALHEREWIKSMGCKRSFRKVQNLQHTSGTPCRTVLYVFEGIAMSNLGSAKHCLD